MTRTKLMHWLVAALAAAFLGGPIALRAVGVKAKAIENSAFAPAPTLGEGWDFFDELTRFLIDRMPLRAQAVRANSWISLNILATTPHYGLNGLGGVGTDQALPFVGKPDQDRVGIGSVASPPSKPTAQPPATATQVVVGTHGWLFLQGVFDRACAPFIPYSEALSRWEALIHVIRASGRAVVLVVGPDKSTIYPEYVASSTPNLACSRKGEAQLWGDIESSAAAADGVIGLRKPLLALKRHASGPLYFPEDSHWDTYGALTFPEAILPALSRRVRVLPSEIHNGGPVHYTGDLTVLLGVPAATGTVPSRTIVRVADASHIDGPSVIIGDSYAGVAFPEIQPYFASPIDQLEWVTNTTQQLVNGIVDAHTVILETIEREFDFRATNGAYVTPQFISTVRRALAERPAP
jgi:hypothetical protein